MADVNCGNWKGSDTEIFRVEKGQGHGCALVVFLIVGLLFMAVGFFLPLELPTRIICGFFGFTLLVIAISSRARETRWRVILDKEKQQMRFTWDSTGEIYCVPFAACRNIVLEKSFLRSRSTGDSSSTRVTWYFEFYLAQADGSRFLIDQIISTRAHPAPDETGPTAELLSSFSGLAVEDLSDNGLDIAGTAEFGDYREPEPPAPGRFVHEQITSDESMLGIRQSKRLLHQLPAICVLMLLLVPVYWLVGEMLETKSFAFLFAIPILILLSGIALFWFLICREIRQKISLRSDEIALEMSLGVTFLPESVMIFPRQTRLSMNIAKHDIEGIRLDRHENTVDLVIGVDSSVRKALLDAPWYLVMLYGQFLSGLGKREQATGTESEFIKLASISLISSDWGPTINDLSYLQYRIKSHFGLSDQPGAPSE